MKSIYRVVRRLLLLLFWHLSNSCKSTSKTHGKKHTPHTNKQKKQQKKNLLCLFFAYSLLCVFHLHHRLLLLFFVDCCLSTLAGQELNICMYLLCPVYMCLLTCVVVVVTISSSPLSFAHCFTVSVFLSLSFCLVPFVFTATFIFDINYTIFFSLQYFGSMEWSGECER